MVLGESAASLGWIIEDPQCSLAVSQAVETAALENQGSAIFEVTYTFLMSLRHFFLLYSVLVKKQTSSFHEDTFNSSPSDRIIT